MKRTLPILLLFLQIVSTNAQTTTPWIASGATWNYRFYAPALGGNDLIEYTHDTLIYGETCQILKTTRTINVIPGPGLPFIFLSTTILPNQYTYSNGDTVFYFVDSAFKVLYNFGAAVGETWDLGYQSNGAGCGPSIVKVNYLSSITFSGNSHRIIYVNDSSISSSVGLSGLAIEHIGSLDYLFPTGRNCDTTGIVYDFYMYAFSCFSDAFESYSVVAPDECENPFHVGINDMSENNISLFPNPVETKAYITFEDATKRTISIYNALGEKMRCLQTANKMIELDLSNFQPGIYFVSFENGSKGRVTRKIIKK